MHITEIQINNSHGLDNNLLVEKKSLKFNTDHTIDVFDFSTSSFNYGTALCIIGKLVESFIDNSSGFTA
jgi:hypothetical protein